MPQSSFLVLSESMEYVKQRIVVYYEKELSCAEIVKALHREQIHVSKAGV